MPISPARVAAFEILLRVEAADAYASELLHSSRLAKLAAADHGLLTELVMGVLRWRGALDIRIAQYANYSLSKLDREVLVALRLGAYQLLFLDRIPGHAAINDSVDLVKRARKKSAAGMVNAVLRKMASSVSQDQRHTTDGITHPQWLFERWKLIWGAEVANTICVYDQSPPRTVVRLPSVVPTGAEPALSDRPQAGSRMGALTRPPVWDGVVLDGIHLEPGKLLSEAAILTAGDISQTSAFRDHRVVIQDEASQLIALLVGEGKSILDCCAAPGGKTRILAERNPDATVLAMDLHPHRARLLRKLVPETNVHVVCADTRQMPFATKFDCILVDAPCSGTGTLARNPEIKWRLAPQDILRLQAYQVEILTAATQRLAEGGRLIYSTCSLEREENEDVISKAMTGNQSFRVVDCGDELRRLRDRGKLVWTDIGSLLAGAYLRTIPGVHPCDGFFAAVLEKL